MRFVEKADHVLTMRNGTIVNEVATEVKSPKPSKSATVSPAQDRKRRTEICSVVLSGMEKRSEGDQEEEEKQEGPLSWWIYWRYFRSGMALPAILVLALLYIATQGETRCKSFQTKITEVTGLNLVEAWFSFCLPVINEIIQVLAFMLSHILVPRTFPLASGLPREKPRNEAGSDIDN